MITADVSEEEEADRNYPPLKIDAITFRSAAKGLIFIRDNKVSNVMAFDEIEIPKEFKGTVLVKPIKVSSVLYSESLPGSGRSVKNTKMCPVCGRSVHYSIYDGKLECIKGHVFSI